MNPQMNANERKLNGVETLWNRVLQRINETNTPLDIGGCTAPEAETLPTTINYLRSFAFICGLILSFIAPLSFADSIQPDIRELDRMFTTRFERAQLDAQRRRMSSGESIESTTSNSVSVTPVNVEMQGIMQREKGGNVAWINGQSTLNSNTIDENIRVNGQPKALSGARVSISGQTVNLKPGQVWQQEDGKVVERYRTKVTAPVTKGADEPVVDVQTEIISKVEPKPILAKPEVAQPKP